MVDVAGRYASALLAAAKAERALPAVAEDMRLLARGLSAGAKAFASPVFPVREQMKTVDAVLGSSVSPLTAKFVRLLVSMRRLGSIGHIAAVFDEMARKDMGDIDLYFTVFEPPAPDTQKKLIGAAGKRGLYHASSGGSVKPRFDVDTTILGGFIAECEGLSWDCSLRSRFVELSKSMRKT
jgi:F0F1-type ATP synthase delta subunit